jgi:hypothetical protein
MRKKLNQFGGQSETATVRQPPVAQAISQADVAMSNIPTVVFPKLDPDTPDYAQKRDERLRACFQEIERVLAPAARPLTSETKKILRTPIGGKPS